jgi:predicted ester cyclase
MILNSKWKSCLLFAASALALAQSLAGSPAQASPDVALTEDAARRIVAPLYDALNEPGKKDVVALLGKATNVDYRSCSTNQDCIDRTELAARFKEFGAIMPDLHWKILDLWTSGNRIVVRGEASGTPVAALFGTLPTGRSFRTISLDVFTVSHGKLATAYHVENWVAAIQQIKNP